MKNISVRNAFKSFVSASMWGLAMFAAFGFSLYAYAAVNYPAEPTDVTVVYTDSAGCSSEDQLVRYDSGEATGWICTDGITLTAPCADDEGAVYNGTSWECRDIVSLSAACADDQVAVSDSGQASGWRCDTIPTLWSTDGTDVYRPAGDVGIGDITPDAKLDVEGLAIIGVAGHSRDKLRLYQSVNPGHTMGTETWHNTYGPDAGYGSSIGHKFYVTGTEVAAQLGTGGTGSPSNRLNSYFTGDVAIGQTSPSATLDIIYGGGDGVVVTEVNAQANDTMLLLDSADGTMNSTNDFMRMDDGVTTRFVVEGEGNVGIGTDSPDVILDVESTSGGAAEIGDSNVSATGTDAVAMGYNTTASNSGAIAAGYNAQATGFGSAAFGSGISSGTYSISSGTADATGYRSAAFGSSTTASGSQSFAAGLGATASGYNGIAVGESTTASGRGSFAAGVYTTSQPYASAVVGRYNEISGNTSSWVTTDPLFVVGNGTSSGARSNALVVDKNGSTTIEFDDLTAGEEIGLHIDVNSASADTVLLLDASDGVIASGSDFLRADDGATTRFVVEGGGHVGIGIADPTAPLHVVDASYGLVAGFGGGSQLGVLAGANGGGGFFSDTNNSGSAFIAVGDNGVTASGNTSGGYFADANNSGYAYIGLGDAGIAAHGNSYGGYFTDLNSSDVSVFLASNTWSVDAAGPININESGGAVYVDNDQAIWYNGTYFSWGFGGTANYFSDSVGIGDSTPDYKLDVVQSTSGSVAKFENTSTSTSANGIAIETGPTSNPGYSNEFIWFTDGDGTYLGEISGNGAGRVRLYGYVNNPSDERLKTNIRDYDGALDTLMDVRPVTYNWKENPADVQIGFIAQELDEVFPYVVSGEVDGDVETSPMGVDYAGLTPLLVGAVQEQQAQIEALKTIVCADHPENELCN